MVTSRTRPIFFAWTLTAAAMGCGSSIDTGTSAELPSQNPLPSSTPTPASNSKPVPTSTSTSTPGPTPIPPELHYPGHGFIVHEWGTDTIVVGSDGSVQRGLHHEEEDLPGFVYDRIKAGSLAGSTSVEVKMETPVTYFYSDTPRTVSVAVDFPKGVFTHWYPAVKSFYPRIVGPNAMPGVTSYRDPVFDLSVPFGSKVCSDKFGAVANGLLDWGSVEVLGRDATEVAVPDAPLDAFTWSYARAVAANPVRVSGVPGALQAAQSERFLFYRGLGDFELPVRVLSAPGGKVSLENSYGEAIGSVFAIHVGGGKGAFSVKAEGIPAQGKLALDIPSLSGATETAAYADALGLEVTRALDATGLYHDEAQAMVNTWKRQWFGTPGVRLLYLVPEAWTDASIPLTVSPAPDQMRRVMMIRVEVIPPELEAVDVGNAKLLGSDGTAASAEAYFKSLGRFAEPRLRRALSLLGDPVYGASFLASITTAETRVGAGE
jgi:hypothetical protein